MADYTAYSEPFTPTSPAAGAGGGASNSPSGIGSAAIMGGRSYSQSGGSSSSSSAPVHTPENDIMDAISKAASGLGEQMNTWAQGEYAKTSGITDQTVNNFLQTSQKMRDTGNNIADQYNNLFAPENEQLVHDANTYASENRLRADMGAAGATAAQAGKAALDNSTQALQQYGIDPSSGRYAALDKAAAVQNAANVAGEMNKQRNQDIATGQQLRSQAVQVGAQLPGALANIENTGIQADTGASNASLANANTGANLNSLADKYLNTAMEVKLPPMGSTSTSSQNSFSVGAAQQGGGGGGGSRSNGSGGGGGPRVVGGGGSGGGSGGRSSMGASGGPAFGDVSGNFNSSMQQGDGGYETGYGTIGSQMYDPVPYANSNPFNDSGFGQTYDSGGTAGYGGLDGTGSTDVGSFYDPGANATSADMSGWGDYSSPDAWGSGSSDDGLGGGDASFGYAAGGAIPEPHDATGGGYVPASASPSAGARTDDVNANLNANEFVIPRDVALWKGQEFFQKLIAQSRMANAKAGAHGRPMPRPQSQPQPQMGAA